MDRNNLNNQNNFRPVLLDKKIFKDLAFSPFSHAAATKVQVGIKFFDLFFLMGATKGTFLWNYFEIGPVVSKKILNGRQKQDGGCWTVSDHKSWLQQCQQFCIGSWFPTCRHILKHLRQVTFENVVGKAEIVHNEQFLLSIQFFQLLTICFQSRLLQICHMLKNVKIRNQNYENTNWDNSW